MMLIQLVIFVLRPASCVFAYSTVAVRSARVRPGTSRKSTVDLTASALIWITFIHELRFCVLTYTSIEDAGRRTQDAGPSGNEPAAILSKCVVNSANCFGQVGLFDADDDVLFR